MTFSSAWSEADPTGSDTASSIDDASARNMVRLRERLATAFPDWTTATERIHMEKIFHNSNGLTGRDDTDAATLWSVSAAGFWAFTKHPMCYAYNSSNSSMSSAAVIPFDAERLDTQSMHSTSSNTGRITIPTAGDGIYLVWFHGLFGNATPGVQIDIQLRKNGVSLGQSYKTRACINTALAGEVTIDAAASFMAAVSLVAADYIDITVTSSDSSTIYFSGTGFGAIKLT